MPVEVMMLALTSMLRPSSRHCSERAWEEMVDSYTTDWRDYWLISTVDSDMQVLRWHWIVGEMHFSND